MSLQEFSLEEFSIFKSNQPGFYRLFIGGITAEGRLVYNEQSSENSGFSDDFKTLTDLTYSPAGFQASTTHGGYVALLAQQNTAEELLYITEDQCKERSHRWAQPTQLGMPSGLSKFTATAMHHGINGLVNVFGTAANDSSNIWWKFQNPNQIKTREERVMPPGTTDPISLRVEVAEPPDTIWSDWHALPKSMVEINAASLTDRKILLAGLDVEGQAYICAQKGKDPFAVENWGEWHNLQDGLGPFQQMEVAANTEGLLFLFARCENNIYMKQQSRLGQCEFMPWVLFASFKANLSTLALGTYKNGGVYVVAQVEDRGEGPLFAAHQTGELLNRWSPLTLIAASRNSSQLVLQPGANTDLNLFALSTDSQSLAYTRQITEDFWQASWTQLASNIESFALTIDVTP